MNFDYTEEQIALQDTLRRFFSRDYGFEHRRTVAASADGFDRSAWKTYAELGLLALPFPSDQGGLDRKSTRLNSSHLKLSRMPSSA